MVSLGERNIRKNLGSGNEKFTTIIKHKFFKIHSLDLSSVHSTLPERSVCDSLVLKEEIRVPVTEAAVRGAQG